MPTSPDKEPMLEYARAVISGDVVASEHVRASCQRTLSDYRQQRKSDFLYRFSPDHADRVERFFSLLKYTDGPLIGQPWVLLPWQRYFLRSLFGWLRKDTGYRRYLKAYIETGKGSGKSPMVANLGVYMLYCDGDPKPQVYVVAKDSKQALVMFKFACDGAESSEHIRALGRVMGGASLPMRISRYEGGYMERVAYKAGGYGVSGPTPSCILADEIHEIESFDSIRLLEAGRKSRPQPLTVFTTNAGAGLVSEAYKEHQYAIGVAHGKIDDPRYFPFVCSTDEGRDFANDESCWPMANPSIEVTPGYEYVRNEVRTAKGAPWKWADMLRLNACKWIEEYDPWFEPDAWMAREVDNLSTKEARARVPCYIALDLAKSKDFTAAALVWDFNPFLEVRTVVWTPADTLKEREDRDNIPWSTWVEEGHIKTVPGKTMKYPYVVQWLLKQAKKYDLRVVAYDQWRMDDIQAELEKYRDRFNYVTSDKSRRIVEGRTLLVRHPQGFGIPHGKPLQDLWPAMPRSISHVEDAVLEGTLKVQLNLALRNAVMTVKPIMDATANRRFHKTKADAPIDVCVAMTMAVGVAMDARSKTPSEVKGVEGMFG